MNLDMENQSGNFLLRDYRKGNWTVQETMVLIEAKQKDEERRMNSEGKSFKPQEHRWKWVEDYCWRHGCLRSQNQCNDKWDNLMRDFKKVRDFDRRMAEKGEENQEGKCSYWKIERSERKEKNLPSNMLPQIYEALVEVVERKGQRVFGGGGGGGGGGSSSGGGGTSNVRPNIGSSVLGQRQRPTCSIVQAIPLPPQLQHHTSAPIAVLPLPPSPQQPPQPPPPPPPPPQSLPCSQPLQISDSDTSEYSDSPAKRRRKGKERGEGTSTAAAAVGTEITNSDKVGSAISKSASLIAGVIQESEEREERRHRELLSIHERRLQIEESKSEINRQGINGLVDSINKLAHSFLALAAHKTQPAPK